MDESVDRQEVAQLVAWGEDNHLQLNATETHEMVVDIRRNKTLMEPLVVNGETLALTWWTGSSCWAPACGVAFPGMITALRS